MNTKTSATIVQDQDYKYRPKREAMVSQLREYGITNARVLEAFRKVKRHLFMDTMFWERAYEDSATPIGANQTISQPYTVAYMTSIIADNYPTGKILEIGTGSGYQAAILSELGYRVFTIERIPALYSKAAKVFEELGLRIATRLGDGTLGWHEMAPYDAIIVTAGSPDVPTSLLEQLNDNGRLIIPVGSSDKQRMMIYHRVGDTVYESATNFFAFVPLIGKDGWKQDPKNSIERH